MPSSCISRTFYSHFQLKLIISKSINTIITKYGINDTKSIGNPTPLMVRSTNNARRFNKHFHPTVLTTYIYYLI